MNPTLCKLLAGYVAFRNAHGLDRQQIVSLTPSEFADLFKWQRTTTPKLRGLIKQCKTLGIDFKVSEHISDPYVFRFHDLRLIDNYAELGDRHDTTI